MSSVDLVTAAAVNRLNTTVEKAIDSIERLNTSGDQYSRRLIRLTWVLIALTIVQAAGAVATIVGLFRSGH